MPPAPRTGDRAGRGFRHQGPRLEITSREAGITAQEDPEPGRSRWQLPGVVPQRPPWTRLNRHSRTQVQLGSR